MSASTSPAARSPTGTTYWRLRETSAQSYGHARIPLRFRLLWNWPALGRGVQKRSVRHTDFMVFRLKDRMRGIYLRQHAPLARNLQPVADMQEFACVETCRDIADDIACSKPKGDPESQRGPAQNEAGYDTHDFRIDFELRHRHHTNNEND